MLPVHYYHVWCDGTWWNAVSEHFEALRKYKFQGDVVVTLTGEPVRRDLCARMITSWSFNLPVTVTFKDYDTGWEDLTLDRMHRDAQKFPDDRYILYCHAKGSYHPGVNQDMWRAGMTEALLDDWPGLTGMMEHGGYLVSGKHYLLPEEFPTFISRPMIAGNFWWARASHVKSIPAVPELWPVTRGLSEIWVTQGNPKVMALSRTWPNYVRGEAE